MSKNSDFRPSATSHANGAAQNVSIVETSKLLPWLMLTSILSGLALGVAILMLWTVEARYTDLAERYRIAEREARVATERYNDIKVELVRRGIPVSDH